MALRVKYGQVEPNHLSAQRTGQIYAQLPAEASIEVLENGQFVKYDYANNQVNFSGEGEWMLVFNEVKLYDERLSYSDFAMIKENYVNGEMYPRVFKTNVGDIFTTNKIVAEFDGDSAVKAGDKFAPNAQGVLAAAEEDAEMIWKVVKVYTMADGEPAVKLQRIK